MWQEDSKGLIPRICEGIFARAATNTEPSTRYSAHVTYLEIYNERVRDLLSAPTKSGDKHTLRVRENPKTGPFVEGSSQPHC